LFVKTPVCIYHLKQKISAPNTEKSIARRCWRRYSAWRMPSSKLSVGKILIAVAAIFLLAAILKARSAKDCPDNLKFASTVQCHKSADCKPPRGDQAGATCLVTRATCSGAEVSGSRLTEYPYRNKLCKCEATETKCWDGSEIGHYLKLEDGKVQSKILVEQ
jgi:hypothetical protein